MLFTPKRLKLVNAFSKKSNWKHCFNIPLYETVILLRVVQTTNLVPRVEVVAIHGGKESHSSSLILLRDPEYFPGREIEPAISHSTGQRF